MFLNYLKKCITTNLISICGYIILLFSLYFLFVTLPMGKKLDILADDNIIFYNTYSIAVFPYITKYLFVILLIVILFILFFIELHLLKKNKIKYLNIFEKNSFIKNMVFWLGYALIPFPIYIFLGGMAWLLLDLFLKF